MSVLISTLKEELTTAKRLEKKYLEALSGLPQGSFILRKFNEKQYGYLTYRKDGQVIQKYLGPQNAASIAEFRNKNEKKRIYKDKLKKVRSQIKILERALRGQSK